MVGTSRVVVMVRPRWRLSAIVAGAGAQLLAELRARGLRAGADIEDDDDVRRDHVGGARRDREAADGRHHLALGVARKAFAQQHRLGGPGERVAPHRHRNGAGMAGFAQKFDVQVGLPDDRRDDAERLVARLQHRPLLDVHLDIGGGLVARVGGGRDVGSGLAVRGERVREGHAVAVGEREVLTV